MDISKGHFLVFQMPYAGVVFREIQAVTLTFSLFVGSLRTASKLLLWSIVLIFSDVFGTSNAKKHFLLWWCCCLVGVCEEAAKSLLTGSWQYQLKSSQVGQESNIERIELTPLVKEISECTAFFLRKWSRSKRYPSFSGWLYPGLPVLVTQGAQVQTICPAFTPSPAPPLHQVRNHQFKPWRNSSLAAGLFYKINVIVVVLY